MINVRTFIRVLLSSGLFSAALVSVNAHALDFGAFGDINHSFNSEDNTTNAFALGGLDFYARQDIDDMTQVFFEYVFETGGSGEIVTDVERLSITRKFNENFSLTAGRVHSPLGYWNHHYHHGVLLQDTYSRPGFLDFEDGPTAIFPTHVIGLMASGDVFNVANGELEYNVAMGNSSSINSEGGFNPTLSSLPKPEIDVNNASDNSDGKLFVARIAYMPNNKPVSVGITAMKNTVVESGDPTAGALATTGTPLVKQTLYGADVKYDQGPFSFLTEYYHMKDDNQVGPSGSNSASAFFVQFGYNVTDPLKVTYRYESVSFDEAADSYFRILDTQEGINHVVDFRYELTESNALYLEINRNDPDANGVDSDTTYILDWAFMMI